MALKVKVEEDKAFIFLYSLLSSYDHLTTTIMYGKKTLELEDIIQMLQNNELMNKTDSTKDDSRLIVKGQGEIKKYGTQKESRGF